MTNLPPDSCRRCPACTSGGEKLDTLRDSIKGKPAPPTTECSWCGGTGEVDLDTASRHGQEMDRLYLAKWGGR